MKRKNNRLETERLILKAYDECDRLQMIDILCNEDIKKTFMLPDFANRKQAEELFHKLIEFSRYDNHFEYGIYWDDVLIGFVNDCKIENDIIEIGYVIHPNYQGKGFATEAVSACIDELFRIGYEQIKAGFFEENIASCRVMEKCGMHKLDIENDEEYQGILHHCLYFGISKTER
ncbi:MAG: GNAT family N-acetyltransferase [Eubacteriales bacterium]|nr:GNAT family N-acetyltransferase [Eubacteriales bacterium]